jgi:hypothetical protein
MVTGGLWPPWPYPADVRAQVVVIGVVLLCTSGIRTSAQSLPLPVPPVPETVPVSMGPVLIRPAVSVAAGGDSNVFNDTAAAKRGDFTLTATPRADVWVRAGRTWLAGSAAEDLSWFRQYASERTTGGRYSIGWVAPLGRVSASAIGQVARVQERPGFEVDLRARRHDRGAAGAVEVSASQSLFLGVRGELRRVEFEHQTFRNVGLDQALNRTETVGGVTARYELTPLTALTVEALVRRDRFQLSPVRDSDSHEVRVGARFDPFALLKGTAQIGYKRFRPLASALPSYDGATANVDLAFVARESTRLGLRVLRDVEYSYTLTEPYYVLTGVTATIAQRVVGPIDVQAKAEGHRLAYRTTAGVATPAGPVDTVRIVGGSVGYRLGRGSRIGVTLDHQRRVSLTDERAYAGWRYGLTLGVEY